MPQLLITYTCPYCGEDGSLTDFMMSRPAGQLDKPVKRIYHCTECDEMLTLAYIPVVRAEVIDKD